MSDQNLQLLPDYEQRIAVLRELGFIDENSRVELKGKVACEVIIYIVPERLSVPADFTRSIQPTNWFLQSLY